MEPKVFITYSSKDEKVSRTICTALENRGLPCWISSRNVKPGQNYQEQIVKAIRAAKIMLLVFTANANNSNEIKKELALASQNSLVVIPLRIEDVTPNEAFTYEFATRQWIDLFGDWENSIGRLVELIAAALDDRPSADGAKAGSELTGDAAAPSIGKIFTAAAEDERGIAAATGQQRQKTPAKNAAWLLPAAVAAACLAVLVIAIFAYLKIVRPSAPQLTSQPNRSAAAPTVTAEPKSQQAEALVPETIPIVSDRVRDSIRDEYLPAPDHKALAISTGPIGFITGQKDDESAKTAALDICQQRGDALTPPRKCELYAVGTTVVYAGGHPPMPPTPWFTHDPLIEKPLVSKDIPLVSDNIKSTVEKFYLPGHNSKALAVSSSGFYTYYFNQGSADEAARRALEVCGGRAGVPCLIVAIDDSFVVPIPTTMKVVSIFRSASAGAIAPELRDELARRLGNAAGGWTAVAAGTGGRIGLMLKAANEQDAIDGALADCAKQDRSCRVIAIGPFAVEPN
ncbi:MAG TPA: toll/interleukin-1 receptor domain-containing protein [Xanthobacteraceae bacterium]|nr:toll/interleukin-1 receptor domain-containing protein [Xanthobacteraceae bacterium]